MREITTTISKRGQITLPVEVQRLLGVGPRDRVAFTIEQDQVRLVPARYSFESVLGSVPPLASGDDFEQQIKDAKDERAKNLSQKAARQKRSVQRQRSAAF